jgi:hypothetical protein
MLYVEFAVCMYEYKKKLLLFLLRKINIYWHRQKWLNYPIIVFYIEGNKMFLNMFFQCCQMLCRCGNYVWGGLWYTRHFKFSFFLFYRMYVFSERLMDCLYSENILISTLPVNILICHIFLIGMLKLTHHIWCLTFLRDCQFFLIKVNISSSVSNKRNYSLPVDNRRVGVRKMKHLCWVSMALQNCRKMQAL